MPSIPPPPIKELEDAGLVQFARWISRLHQSALHNTLTINSTIAPAQMAASAMTVQTFTVKGLKQDDAVSVNKPTNTDNIGIVGAWVPADDTLAIKFHNKTASAIDLPSEIYKIIATRVT